jgi:hypothetical protein
MLRRPVVIAITLLVPSWLCSCSRLPADATSRYSYLPVPGDDRSGLVRRDMLWPEACMAEPAPADPPLGKGPPPGCANDYNLLHMAERERDLVRGRRLGPAPAAPSARAARKYIDGNDVSAMGAGISDAGGVASPGGDESVPAGKPAASSQSVARQ